MGPRSFGQVLDGAFGIYTSRFGALARVAATILLPVAAAIFLVDLWAFQPIPFREADFNDYIRLDGKIVEENRIVVDIIFTIAVNILAYLLVVGASLRAASQAYLGNDVEVGASIRFALRRFASLFWLGLLLTVFLGIGSFLLVIPAIYMLVVWIVAIPALLFEGRKGFKALGRSYDLIQGHWWRTFGLLLIVGIFTAIVGGVIPALISGAVDGVGDDNFTLWLLLQNLISIAGSIVSAPMWASLITVLYYDERVRKEGFDVEMMVGRIDEPGSLDPDSQHSVGAGEHSSTPPPPAPPPPAAPPA